jgi:hypothetical protein
MATSSEMRAACQAFIFTAPSNTNSVSSGNAAKIEDNPNECDTGL